MGDIQLPKVCQNPAELFERSSVGVNCSGQKQKRNEKMLKNKSWLTIVLSSDSLTLIGSETHYHCPYVSRTQTSSPSSLEVSCSLSLRRCLLKAGWSVRVYEENPAPFCSRKQAISSLPATQNKLLTPLLSVHSTRGGHSAHSVSATSDVSAFLYTYMALHVSKMCFCLTVV